MIARFMSFYKPGVTIDQPEGRTLGQVRLVFGSSKVIPENKVTTSLSILILSKTDPMEGV